MNFFKENAGVIALVAIVIAIGGYFFPQVAHLAGSIDSATNFGILGTAQIKVGTNCDSGFGFSGCNGSKTTRFNSGQCYFAPSSATIAASTTVTIDCQATQAPGAAAPSVESALTGITLGDNVVVQLSTTTAQLGAGASMGLIINGASASTTAGYITVRLTNLNGTTFTWPVGAAASGTASYIVTAN